MKFHEVIEAGYMHYMYIYTTSEIHKAQKFINSQIPKALGQPQY